MELDPAVNVPVTVTTVWTGPDKFMTTNTAQPIAGSNITYTSTAVVDTINGSYNCQATVNSSFIISAGATSGSTTVIVGMH